MRHIRSPLRDDCVHERQTLDDMLIADECVNLRNEVDCWICHAKLIWRRHMPMLIDSSSHAPQGEWDSSSHGFHGYEN